MTEVNSILAINSLDGLLKYEITVKTILIVGVISGLIGLSVIIHFGGIRNTLDYFVLRINSVFNTYVGKKTVSGGKRDESKIDNDDKNDDKNDIIDK